MSAKRKIMIVCGGTGGHVFPALAVAGKLREKHPDLEIVFVVKEKGFEESLIRKQGFRTRGIVIKGWARGEFLVNLPLLFMFPRAVAGSLSIMREEKPDMVFGTGGYVCMPLLAAAVLTDRPVYLQEQNVFPGITVRLFARFARHIFLGYGEAASRLRTNGRVIATGNPVREDAESGRRDLRTEYGIAPEKKILFVFGGSQGSRPINQLLLKLVPGFMEKGDLEVLWQTGRNEFEAIRQAVEGTAGVRVFPFLDNIYDYYRCADLVVCRAGALTIAELARFGLPALFIPLPTAAADHQTRNARMVEDAGGGLCIPQSEAGERIAVMIRTLLADTGRLDRMRRNMAALGRTDAAGAIAQELGKEIYA